MVEKNSKEYEAVVYVGLKEGVLDPQGLTIKRALKDMGYNGIEEVKAGKFFQIKLKSNNKKMAEEKVDEICCKLLTNPVIEKYSFKVEK